MFLFIDEASRNAQQTAPAKVGGKTLSPSPPGVHSLKVFTRSKDQTMSTSWSLGAFKIEKAI
jgi:hypothetical protein